MFVVSRRNIILPGPNGEKFHMPKDFMGKMPDWAEKSAYLEALIEDGKVIVSDSGRDKDVDAALKGKRKGGKNKKNPDLPAQDSVPNDPPAPEDNPDGEEEES